MNGITYYRLKSDYPGDYTKNCALNGTEVDNNFYVLEGRDVKSISVNGKDIIVTLLNGDNICATGVLDFAKPDDVKSSVINVEFDKLNGVLILTSIDGTTQRVEGFATNENTDFSVSTDNTLCGDGLRNAPLGVAPSAKTGQFKTVKSIINIAEGGALPACGNILGDRYVTCEDISDYGYLYDYRAVREIACELKNTGWRIPTKADWDDLLNAVEPCECDKTHESAIKNKFLGKWAGKLLKSKTMWRNCDCSNSCCDCCDCNNDCGCCNNDCDCNYNCNCNNKPNCGCDNDCTCGQDTCFDYSDDPCVGTKECESNCKCEKSCQGDHQGLDAFGFRVTPAGYADDGCNFGYFRERGAFWTATTDQDNTKAYIKRFQYNKDGVYQDVIPSNYHLSLRLVKDYNGKNYFDVEEIMDMEYPTLLLPSISKGKSIWTSCNFACGDASLCPMLPNNGQGLTYTRHYFINEWNGFRWVRNEMKQGDSVVVAKAPKGKTMVEYRVIGNDLVSVNEMIYNDVMKDITIVTDNLEEKLTERIDSIEKSIETEREERLEVERQLWEGINGETERAQKVEADLWEGIAKETAAREEVDTQQWTAIENEGTIRQAEDAKIYDALAQEVTDRQTEDGKLHEALAQEVADRQSEDGKLHEALAQETEDRISVDNQQWEVINTEIEERKAADEALQEAINAEAATREAEDAKLQEAINTETEERKAADEALQTAIDTEAATRESEDAKLQEAIDTEAATRESEDAKLQTAIDTEIEERKAADEALQTAIDTEAATREAEDAKLQEAINTETEERKAADEALQEAIDAEAEERKAKDEEIEGKLLTVEGTEFDPNSGELTLKSAAGTNDIKVQFSFNFGEF